MKNPFIYSINLVVILLFFLQSSFSQDILLFVVTILILVSGFLIVQAVHFPRKKSIEIDKSRKDFIASFLNLISSG